MLSYLHPNFDKCTGYDWTTTAKNNKPLSEGQVSAGVVYGNSYGTTAVFLTTYEKLDLLFSDGKCKQIISEKTNRLKKLIHMPIIHLCPVFYSYLNSSGSKVVILTPLRGI